jgi:hypothetical protein
MKAIAAALLAVALLGGCSSGDDADPTVVASGATTSTAPAACPANTTQAPTVDATTAAGDFDGDGRPDRLVTGRVAAAGAWRVRMELAAGGGAETELPATAEGVKAIGAATVDVGPAQAAFAVVARNAAGSNVGLFVFRSCKVERVTMAGKPAEFAIGTGATARTGLACQVPGLVAYQATTTDGRFYQAGTLTYLLVGTILDEVHRSTSNIGADDAALAPYGRFTCGPLSL